MGRGCGWQRGAAPYLQSRVPRGPGGGGRPSCTLVATAEAGFPEAGEKVRCAASLATGTGKQERNERGVIKV